MANKKNHILFFGTYKKTYTRTMSFHHGLESLGYRVSENHIEVADERLELPEDYTLARTLHRVWRKVVSMVELVKNARLCWEADAIMVLHPGHLDLPLAKVLSLLSGKPILFDAGISPYDIMFVGRSMADRKSLKAKIVKWVEMLALRLPDVLIVDTKQMRQFFVSEFGVADNKIVVIPLGANDDIYTPAQKPVVNTKTEVFFFGLFNPMHGLPFIMDAIETLKSEPSIHFTILGDGYLKPELVKRKEESGLTNLDLVGFVPEKELATWVQKSDIMLGIFTNSGTFQKVVPNKVFAGAACKKAVITADLPAVHDFFTHGKDIYLCKPENAASLIQAIQTLAKNKTLRDSIATNAYIRFQENYSNTQTVKILDQTIVRILKHK